MDHSVKGALQRTADTCWVDSQRRNQRCVADRTTRAQVVGRRKDWLYCVVLLAASRLVSDQLIPPHLHLSPVFRDFDILGVVSLSGIDSRPSDRNETQTPISA